MAGLLTSKTWSMGHWNGRSKSLPGIFPECGAHQRSKPHLDEVVQTQRG
jgi:hypothetical protein